MVDTKVPRTRSGTSAASVKTKTVCRGRSMLRASQRAGARSSTDWLVGMTIRLASRAIFRLSSVPFGRPWMIRISSGSTVRVDAQGQWR